MTTLDMSKFQGSIPKDTIFVISSGEYDDYKVYGIYQALQDIMPAQLARFGRASLTTARQGGATLLAWLTHHQVIRLVSRTELYCGDCNLTPEHPWEAGYTMTPEMRELE